jgi:pyridoxamine 5'-phosphate oxidase
MSGDSSPDNNPFVLFSHWLAEAGRSELNDPSAMALATVDADGLPDVRIVLLKAADEHGFTFYTNTESQKGVQLEATGRAACVFHWKSLRRQVRLRGLVSRVSDAEADAYFASRPRASRIGAWASAQSRPLASRGELEAAVVEITARYGDGPIPRPEYWTGYRIEPLSIEFWQDQPSRLHDRLVFRRPRPDAPWSTGARLFP